MAKVAIATLDTASVVDTPAGAGGKVETRTFFPRQGDPIDLYVHELAPGASVTLDASANDYMAYVWKGEVEAGGTTLDPRSSMIVEFGRTQAVTAGTEGATVLVFQLKERPAQPRPGGHVYLLPNRIVPRTTNLGSGKAGGALHADAHGASSELWLHENDFYVGDSETALHSHSEDEVIFVRDGAIRLGNKLYGPGTALSITANTKYGFYAGPEGLSFVNFRAAPPTYTAADGSHVLDEAKFWVATVGAPQYLEPQAA
jgi:hypothetical protein